MPITRRSYAASIRQSTRSDESPKLSLNSKVTRSNQPLQVLEDVDEQSQKRSAKRRRVDDGSTSVHPTEQTKTQQTISTDTTENDHKPMNNELSQNEVVSATALAKYTYDAPASQPQVSNPTNTMSTPTSARMKIDSLPILDNLSSQMISLHAKLSHQEVLNMVSDPASDRGREYVHVSSLFEHTKQLYTNISCFLSPAALELQESGHVDIVRKANLATFISSLFGVTTPLKTLDAHFLDIFVPEGGRLLKLQASLWLELKTQAFIRSVTNRPKHNHDEDLATLFDENIERQILRRRPGARGLAPSELDFVKRLIARREFLAAELNASSAKVLPEKYRWDDFLREVTVYISKSSEGFSGLPDRNDIYAGRLSGAVVQPETRQRELEGQFSIHGMPAATFPLSRKSPTPPPIAPPKEDFVTRAARAAQIALQGQDVLYPNPRPPPPTPPPVRHATQPYQQVDPQFQHYTPPTGQNQSSRSTRQPQNVPHSSQTAPTQVLYERARMATTAKVSPMIRKNSAPSQRRPWTSEEEQALMEGLDRVRGPHWSQILGMFGAGGTENEKLKDRNQVQLKDKARNLKLFFLKSGIEVPFYLKYVTGDLKTRAPAQASKQEARERERLQVEEDQAHFDGIRGIMALAGGQATAHEPPELISQYPQFSPPSGELEIQTQGVTSETSIDSIISQSR